MTSSYGFQLLEKHKITLKIPDFEDYEHFYQMRFTPEVVYWADDKPQYISLEEYALERIAAQESNEIIERIIVLDGEPIGTITARDYVARTCQCTLGIVIANPACWGHGYGYEALRQFFYILSAEGIGRLFLETYANNKRAQKCFHKLGFRKKRVFFSPGSGRFIVQMIKDLPPMTPIGEVITRDDPRWRPPRR